MNKYDKEHEQNQRYYERYMGKTQYEKVWNQMQLLGIEDITTRRQDKNGTIVWRLPIKNHDNRNPSYIEVASFTTGYVRNQNSGYSNYQLNKRCMSEPQYYPERKYNPDTNEHVKTGKYLKFETRGCKLIPIEIDRLEYLLKYCVKNYYIKHANQVPNGDYIPKWKYDDKIHQAHNKHNKAYNDGYAAGQVDYKGFNDVSVTVNGERYKII